MTYFSPICIVIAVSFWIIFPSGTALAGTFVSYQQDEVRGTLTLVSGEQREGYFTNLDENTRFTELLFREEGSDDVTAFRAGNFVSAETETGGMYYSFSSGLSREAVPSMIGERIYETDHSLFMARDGRGNHHFYVINDSGQAVYLHPNRFSMLLRSLFGECRDVVRDYSDIDAFYGSRYLSRVFLEYDRCMGYEQDETVRRYGTTVNRSRFGLGIGLFSHRISYEFQSQTQLFREAAFGYENSIDISLFWDYRLGRRPFFVRPQLVYRSAEASLRAETGTRTEEQAFYKIRTFSLVVPLRYEFMYGPARPYVAAGGLLSFNNLSETEYAILVERPDGAIQEDRRELFELDAPLGFGAHAGLGVRFPELIGQADVFAEVRYTYHSIEDTKQGRIFDVAFQGFDFSLAIGF